VANAWRWTVRKLLGLWVRVSIKPDDAAAEIAARPRPVCYVLERESQTDFAVLSMVCNQFRLPRLERRLLIGSRRADKAYFELIRPAGLFTTRQALSAPRYLLQLIGAAAADPAWTSIWCPSRFSGAARRTRKPASGVCCSPKIGCWSGDFVNS
jgi:glycerol-3-phosphate O-acyltransferase